MGYWCLKIGYGKSQILAWDRDWYRFQGLGHTAPPKISPRISLVICEKIFFAGWTFFKTNNWSQNSCLSWICLIRLSKENPWAQGFLKVKSTRLNHQNNIPNPILRFLIACKGSWNVKVCQQRMSINQSMSSLLECQKREFIHLPTVDVGATIY